MGLARSGNPGSGGTEETPPCPSDLTHVSQGLSLSKRTDRLSRVGETVATVMSGLGRHGVRGAMSGEPSGAQLAVLDAIETVSDPLAAEQIFGMAVGHPSPRLRAALIDFVRSWLPSPEAAETLLALVRDPDDLVALKAIGVGGEEAVEHLVPYLVAITHWPSESEESPGKPVGLGAAHVHVALTKILNRTRQSPESAEAFFRERGTLPDEMQGVLSVPEDAIAKLRDECPPDMKFVPGGWSMIGLPGISVPDRTFGWRDSTPSQKVWLPPYLMDEYPVTNDQYDEFAGEVQGLGHRWCHPLEPPNKLHDRNTADDSRFGHDHPVTGVDWYDAYSYSRWAEKQLPTEFQWEKAARGPSNLVWPWGNEWDGSRCNWSGRVFDLESSDLPRWRASLVSVSSEFPRVVTTSVTAFPDGKSGYGIMDLVGNAWEWTRSESETGRFYSPSLRPQGFRTKGPVLKGGAWSSLPGLMFPSYRGRDAPFCRHSEIGFRCVRNLPIKILRKAGLPTTRNTAVY